MKIVHHENYGDKTPPRPNREQLWNRGMFTLIVDWLPDNDEWPDIVRDLMLGKTWTMNLKIGIAYLHPKDDYNRKIGYKTAHQKQKLVAAQVSFVAVDKNGAARIGLAFGSEELFITVEQGKRPVYSGGLGRFDY